jgi:hypothetical protein
MPTVVEMLRMGRHDEVWQLYCGFLDMTLADFMAVQERLLLEQLDMVNNSPWGEIFFNGAKPTTVKEFRLIAPLTRYENYAPYLEERREDLLPRKPITWGHTSGRSGKYKWAPFTQEMFTKAGLRIMGAFVLAMARRRGEVRLGERDVLVYNAPPRPYASGIALVSVEEQFPFRFVPPADLTESLTFQERLELSFKMAMVTGIDLVGSITSVLVKIGERFASGAGGAKPSRDLLHPQAMWRVGRALVRSRLAGRPMLPKDLWPVKGVICGGTDTGLYKDIIAEYWGATPYEVYAATEAGITAAAQAWDKKGLYFFPDVVFFEFIPEDEWARNREDASYTPSTVLLDEVRTGQRYELVITSLDGGAFLRYRMGDMVRFITLKDEEAGIALPSMVCVGRSDDLIDLAGFTGLIDEPMIGRAIFDAGFPYEDWSARKETSTQSALIHIYLELKDEAPIEAVQSRIHDNLKTLNPFYADLETVLEMRPLRVTVLKPGTFRAYYLERQAAGADLAHLKPPRMGAPDAIIADLLRLSGASA